MTPFFDFLFIIVDLYFASVGVERGRKKRGGMEVNGREGKKCEVNLEEESLVTFFFSLSSHNC